MLRTVLPGVLLFAFIPLVLYLFVAHPEPVAASLVGGVVLMLGHRLAARPHMAWAKTRKCLWCNHPFVSAKSAGDDATIELLAGRERIVARVCRGHDEPVARFFAFAERWRLPLRLGIFVPLLALLAGLALHAAGRPVPLAALTAGFQLAIGLTVNVAAWGYLAATPARPAAVPFPVHNFFLLGVRALLWILRLVGIWWIVKGGAYFLAG